ncbi:MAG: formate dehydrogenase subunit alpha [Alphaproteobacteria bacterium]|nr:formate dehydrogenase subunit alpha [Rhodospirillaceae bacterium]MBT6204610.1 formate dehydrogenase subunit alpha [Rhodospirillaceae bacterium]MBT6511043.1 formate dehydrogenase subunit alpha [Rhodospirillaceae bacterium]MDG2481442.1 formate dehydrogenase subunit alpha [Alphaproteobacteria bacterium]
MSEAVIFSLDGEDVTAEPGESIWQVAKRHGKTIPHLCYTEMADYRADGNCRVCMVEIEGERTLAASCIRDPLPGMVVKTDTDRAEAARNMVLELLLADQPVEDEAHTTTSEFWGWAHSMGIDVSRFPRRGAPVSDLSHPAMAINLDACIHCNRCVRACREIQVNNVIGMAYRGGHAKIVFDFDDPMGESTCVACGECVQSCPTGALMEKTLIDEAGIGKPAPAKEVDSVCPYCGVGCQLTYQVEDNAIVAVKGKEGPANHGRLCVKGRFGFDYINHAQRLTKPLIRLDDAPKGADEWIDPANPFTHFREATWEEALEKAASGLAAIRDEDGPNALAGFGSAKGSNEEAYLFQKLVRTGFGTNNVDHCTRLCHASSVAALMETIGSGAVTAPFTEAINSDCFIVIGANPTENHPVAATFFKNSVKRGAKLIVMDPRGQALRKHATHMLQFKPGGDVSMLNAIMHVIIEEELYDKQYVQGMTEGFDELKAHLKDFTPEAMEPICGIPADTLRDVARTYAGAEKAMVFWGMGISQHIHGTDNSRCLIALALMTGHTGRPGTGLHPLRGQNNVQGASDAGLIPMFFPDYKPVAKPEHNARFEELWDSKLDDNPGLTVVEIMDAVHADKLHGMYIMGENPAMSDPNVHHARAALAKLRHLVVQDLFLTETAMHADVVLPASAWPEKDGTVTNTNRQVQRGRQAVLPPGEARQDWEIIQSLAQGVGLDWNYGHISEVYEELRQATPSITGISWDRVTREDVVVYPCLTEDDPGSPIVFSEAFPTESKRGKMVPANIVQPDEMPDADFPMVLTTGRVLEHWHTGAMTRRATMLDSLEPEAIATMAPVDMERLGVAPGELVRISTRRGMIEAKARIDSGIQPGMIFVPFCFVEASANLLTNAALDPFGKIPEFKFCAVRVDRAAMPEAAE